MTVSDYDAIKDKYKVSVYQDMKGKKVKFYEMIHIAPKEFYDKRSKLIKDDISKDYLIFHEGVKGIPDKKRDLMNVYKALGESVDWVLQPKPDYPVVNIDVEYNKMKYSEKTFLKSMDVISKIMLKMLGELKKDEEKYNKFIDELRTNLIELEDEPDAFDDSFKGRILKPMIQWSKGFLLDSRNSILVNAILNEEKNVSLIWGKAHHRGVRSLLNIYGYKLVTEDIVE